MKKSIYFAIFFGIQTILSQAVSDDISVDQILRNEYNTIKVARIEESSFLFPNIIRETNRTHINFLSQKNIRIEPVLGIRWGSAGFEIDPLNTPSPVLWVSPGIKLAGSTYLFDPLLNLWLYAWGRFHKHSAYGFNGSPVLADQTLFRYHPDYSAEYYSRTIKPDNGIDFDESLGGVALVHPRFHIVWGKFRDHMGPSSRSNLQLSRLMPAFSQLRVVMKPTMQIQFMYLIGQFDSMIPDSNLYHNVYQDNIDETQKIPTLSRYIAMHRIDVLNSNNTFRIGIWEQVIFGARSIPFEYMNPLTLFWSAQHKLGDLDNVQMGIDWELMVKNQRFYGSLLVDEWAPYDTFKGSHEHNWVGSQLGTSRIFGINDHRVMFTAEYTYMDPRTSYHRFPVNDPQHHNYNIGYWSGGHSDDWWLGLTWFQSPDLTAELYWTSSRKGNQTRSGGYENDSALWMSGDVKKRSDTGLKIWFWDSRQIQYFLNLRWVDSRLLYTDDHFFDGSISILYNLYQ